MEVIKSSHSVYCLKYHVVWVCKYRRRILNPAVRSYIRKVLSTLKQEVSALTSAQIIILDEVQKLPRLLNDVHFFLSFVE